MNVKFLNKYAVVVNGEYAGFVWYLAPLGSKQRYREQQRISRKPKNNCASFKDVRLLRTYG